MYQKTILIGRVGNPPQFHNDPHGQAVCAFSLGVQRGRNQAPLWFWITTWGSLAVECKARLVKHTLVQVEGQLTGGDDGHPRLWKVGDKVVNASFDLTASVVTPLDCQETVSVETVKYEELEVGA